MQMKKLIAMLFAACAVLPNAYAEQVSKEQIKGLDEQVQDIKKDVLEISAELNQLEEKLLYPSNTEIAFFVSLEKSSTLEPDAIELKVDDKDMATHIYSFKELEALRRGGVQRLFTGNVRTGEHKVLINIIGKSGAFKKTDNASYVVKKGVGPQFLEIRLTSSGVEFKDW